MEYDLQIIPDTSGEVSFFVRGKSSDTGLMLLQRLYVLLFSDQGGAYRSGEAGIDLCGLLDGSNAMSDDALSAVLAMARTYALSALSEEDRQLIDSFECTGVDGAIYATLTLADGTTIEGTIEHA